MADGRNLEKVKELAAYRVSEEMYVEEMDSRAMVLEHIKSGARIFLMSNEDENKVFYISVFVHRPMTVRDFPIYWNTVYWKARISFRSRTPLWNW